MASDNGCKQVDRPAAKPDGGQKPPDKPLAPNEHPELTFTTNCGSFTVRLDPKLAPNTGASLVKLAKNGFYDDTRFFRGGMTTGGQFFEYLRDAFDMLYREGARHPKMMSVGLHCRIAGHPGRAVGLDRFLDHVARHPGVWICRRGDIARHA